MPTSDRQGPIGTSISNLQWEDSGECWRSDDLGLSQMQVIPVPNFHAVLHIPGPSQDHSELPWYPQGTVPKPEIKLFQFWYCITQGYETQEFERSETTGKSGSSESMTFRYLPDMINLVFFIWKVKIKGMQLYLSTYIFWNYTFHLSRHEQGSNIGKSFVSSVSYGAHAKNIFSSLKILA